MKILVGADPELFGSTKDGLISAHGMIPGSKKHPHPVNKGAIQVDGMAFEFNIDPASSADEFVMHIDTVMEQLRSMVPHVDLQTIPVAEFGEDYINGQPFEAQELGCDPDFNAYTQDYNKVPDGKAPFRTASGHVHVGWGQGLVHHFDMCVSLVKAMDVFLGLPSVLFDQDTKRRELYGQAGAFRPKSYGVEYRTLSNKWLSSNSLQRWVYNNTLEATRFLREGGKLGEMGDVATAINNSDVALATELLNKYSFVEVPDV